jgi:D-arabinose 1-dehydrogenase-like Zn-dependent alcohol dehydrogenase
MLFEPNDQGLILGQNPVTIGHEATGVVVSTGSGDVASKFKAGDNVGFLCAVECCFECEQCRTVHNAYCTTGKTKMQGFSLNGYFQEYIVVDARSTMVLPEGCKSSSYTQFSIECLDTLTVAAVDVKTAAPLFCAGVTAYHGVQDCELREGEWMAIIGCGGLGHLGIQYAKYACSRMLLQLVY